MSNRSRKRPEKKRPKPPQDQRPKIRLSLLQLVLGVATLIGGAAAYLTLLPRLSVSAQDPLDAHNPFLAPFVISNDGYIDLYDLQTFCFPVHVELIGIDGKGGSITLKPTKGYREEDMDTGMTSPNYVADKLLTGNKMTFPCKMILPPDFDTNLAVRHAEISYIVTYRLFGVPFKRHHVNHFGLSRDTSGHARWMEEPLVSDTRR